MVGKEASSVKLRQALARIASVLIVFSLSLQNVRATPPAGWRSVGSGGGGALFAPSFSPLNRNEIYLACVVAGQFHSFDAAVCCSLTPSTRLQAGSNSPNVQFTNNPQILYMIVDTHEVQAPVKSTDA